jgi:hypothetical protein
MLELSKKELIDLFLYKNNVSERASGIIRNQIASLEDEIKNSIGKDILVQSVYFSQRIRNGLEKEDEGREKFISDKTRAYGIISKGDLTIDDLFFITIPTNKHMTYYEDGIQEGGIRVPMKIYPNHGKLPICINPKRSVLYGIENTTDIHIGDIVRKIFPGGNLEYAKARDLLDLEVPNDLKKSLEAYKTSEIKKTLQKLDDYIGTKIITANNNYLNIQKFPEDAVWKLTDMKTKIEKLNAKLGIISIPLGNVPGKHIGLPIYLMAVDKIIQTIKEKRYSQIASLQIQ